MSKEDRSKHGKVYMCADLYLVTYLLPNKMPCSLDPFLYPLITEIEDTFIDGIL